MFDSVQLELTITFVNSLFLMMPAVSAFVGNYVTFLFFSSKLAGCCLLMRITMLGVFLGHLLLETLHLTYYHCWMSAAGTDNSDQARDVDLPLKERFYLQPKTPQEAADRVKVAAQEIIDTKPLIARKAWPYVQNGLRSSASYLRFDLNTIVASKPKEQRKSLKDLTAKMLAALDNVRILSSSFCFFQDMSLAANVNHRYHKKIFWSIHRSLVTAVGLCDVTWYWLMDFCSICESISHCGFDILSLIQFPIQWIKITLRISIEEMSCSFISDEFDLFVDNVMWSGIEELNFLLVGQSMSHYGSDIISMIQCHIPWSVDWIFTPWICI